MKDNVLNQYVVQLLKSMEHNLTAYIKNKKPECLHGLRVDIKKIRAIFYFADEVYNEKYKVTSLKPLFDKAGKIREIQINIQLLNEFPKPPKRLITELKIKENGLIGQFVTNGSHYGRLIKNIGQNARLPEITPGKKVIKNFFKREKRKASKELQNRDRESMHHYRMKIKKMMYVYDVLPKKLQKEIELNEEEINEQQKKLGDWHDIYSAIHFLSHKYFPKSTVQYILKMKEKERKQFNSLLNNLKHI